MANPPNGVVYLSKKDVGMKVFSVYDVVKTSIEIGVMRWDFKAKRKE